MADIDRTALSGRRIPDRIRILVAAAAAALVGLSALGCGHGDGRSADPTPRITVTSAVATLPHDMPADFGFALAYGIEARNEIDTFAGTFTKDMIEDPPVTTELRLSPDELGLIYRRMAEIKIEDYPVDFRPADTGQGFGAMYDSYRLTMRAGGREYEILWDDQNSSTAQEATALRQLFQDIRRMIEARDEYKKLPPARGGYI